MSLNHDHAPFWVYATNIVTGDIGEVFGPFPGPATLTYENLRAGETDHAPGETIFFWIDPQDVGKDNPHGYDSWEGDDETRYDGWRRVEHLSTEPGLTFDRAVGPFFTDLFIHAEPPEES